MVWRTDTLIVNSNGKSVVVLSLDEYNAINETGYLLSSEKNKAMMYKAKEEIESGKLNEVDLNELIQKTNHD